MIILYISWRRFQNIWNKKTEPFLKICYHGLKNFQKGFENTSSQEPPITAVLNFSMYSLLSVYDKLQNGCHPLREDVSWNPLSSPPSSSVPRHPLREDVSWNNNIFTIHNTNTVILFVRMWVEMLKEEQTATYSVGHPLREDVSWNIDPVYENNILLTSSSSWGCELKYHFYVSNRHSTRSSSSWGCELK